MAAARGEESDKDEDPFWSTTACRRFGNATETEVDPVAKQRH